MDSSEGATGLPDAESSSGAAGEAELDSSTAAPACTTSGEADVNSLKATNQATQAAGYANGSGADQQALPTEVQEQEAAVCAAPSKPLSWAERAQKNAAAAAAAAGSDSAKVTGAATSGTAERGLPDYLFLLAARRDAAAMGTAAVDDAAAASPAEEELPQDLQRFKPVVDAGINNIAKANYVRLGIRNDANNCYVNVVVHSLLSSAALVWVLRHCTANDAFRPFCTCLVKVFKEFHTRKHDAHGGGVLNALAIPEVRDIITRWQRLGAQQDAGEFLMYLLNGVHDECKWHTGLSESSSSAAKAMEDDGSDWSHLVKNNSRRVESRSAGMQEDSPISRIFGGVMRSLVRTKGAKIDSASLEAFNHLLLDISRQDIDSLWTALAAHCGAESINDGEATRRLLFESLPKVMILSLKRFEYSLDYGGVGRARKIKKLIKFGEKLTLDRSWLTEGLQSPEYVITAVICHHGDKTQGGHYTALVRYNTEWYQYDDTVVRKVDAQEVAAQQSSAYLLVYQHQGKVELSP